MVPSKDWFMWSPPPPPSFSLPFRLQVRKSIGLVFHVFFQGKIAGRSSSHIELASESGFPLLFPSSESGRTAISQFNFCLLPLPPCPPSPRKSFDFTCDGDRSDPSPFFSPALREPRDCGAFAILRSSPFIQHVSLK